MAVLYIAETSPPRIRRVGTDGNIVTVVALLDSTGYLAVNAAGDLLVSHNGTIGKLNADGSLTQLAKLEFAAGLAADRNGNLFVAVPFLGQVWKLDALGNQSVVAGGGKSSQDGVPAVQASLPSPTRVAVDPAGNLYIAESNFSVGNVRKVDTNGIITTVGGVGAPGGLSCCAVATDTSGAAYTVSETAVYTVWKTAPGGVPQLFAGGGIGDGGPADRAFLSGAPGLAIDGSGNIYLADLGNNRIRKIDSSGVITTVAGAGMAGFGGDGGSALQAMLNGPAGVVFDGAKNMFIADTLNNRVRKVDRMGTITTVAGTGAAGFSGDGGAASSAALNGPTRVAFSPTGELYFVDQANSRIRMISAAGIITTVAGNGINHGCCIPYPPMGDGGPATEAVLETPGGIAFDAAGDLYICELYGSRIRKVTPAGMISTAIANLSLPSALALDAQGNIYVADFASIEKLSPEGKKIVLAGSPTLLGNYAFGVPGSDALFGLMWDLVLEPNGSVLSSDSPLENPREGYVREISPANIFPLEVFNAASGQPVFLSPGEIVSISWANFGPQMRVTAVPGSDGRYPTTLAGTEVLFNDIAAPVLNVDSQQVTTIVPYALSGMDGANVRVVYEAQVSNTIALPLQPASPGLFAAAGGTGQLAALNADGTLNSPSNPAARGSEVVLFATGAGLMSPPVPDGAVTRDLSAPVSPVSVQIGGANAQVVYAGSAPGLVSGVLQLNVLVPQSELSGNVPVVVTIAGASSQTGATVSVR